MSAPAYRVQVRGEGETWRMVLGGVQAVSVAMKAAEREADKVDRTAPEHARRSRAVRVLLGDMVIASWTDGVRDLRGAEA